MEICLLIIVRANSNKVRQIKKLQVTENTNGIKKFDCLGAESFLALPPPSVQMYYKWAETLFELHRLQEASNAYTECLKLDPSNLNAMYKRGLTRGLLKNVEGSLDDLSSVLLQRFVRKVQLAKQTISESTNRDTKVTEFQQVVPDCSEFFKSMAEFEDLGKGLQQTFDDLFKEPDCRNSQKEFSTVGEGALGTDETVKREKSTLKEEWDLALRNSEVHLEEIGKLLDDVVVSKKSENVRELQNSKKNEAIGLEINLSSVQGLEKAKERLWNNAVLPLKRPDLFLKFKKKRGFTILLYGPPGCGKTLLVRALTGETGSHLVLAKLHELMDPYVGQTERNIHYVFENARELLKKGCESCIVFLDELDAIGVNRGLVSRESTGSHRDAVNQLLMELDGVEKNPEGLFVIGASNRPWDVDAALKRSGRFGECIYIPPPSYEARKQLFKYYAGNCKGGKLDFDSLAKATEGCSAADIETIVEEAKMRPILREHQTGVESLLYTEDFEEVLADPVFEKGTLKDWYLSVANELSHKSLDEIRYKPMVDEIKRALQKSKSALAITPCA